MDHEDGAAMQLLCGRTIRSRGDRSSVPAEVLYWVKVLNMPRTRSIVLEGRLETRAVLPWTGISEGTECF